MIKLSGVKIHKLGTKTGLIALLLILAILLGESLFSWSHSRNELNRNFEAESDSLTSASAEAMNLPLWDFDVETLQIMTESLAENPNVISVMFWIIRSLVKPIEALERIINEYDGRNSIEYVPGENRTDELGSLAQGFKRMASQIHNNVSTLEERVAERTEELNEAVIKASAANKAKTEFLANMSHEIRTPLNGVLGMLDVLRQTPLTKQQFYYTDIIDKSGNNLLTILSDILDLSKIEAGKETFRHAPCNLKNLVQETVTLFAASASEKNLDLSFDYEPNLPNYFVTDINRIRQILSNLVGNAIKFTPEGRVSVDVIGQTEGDYTNVEISVKDTGIGIGRDKLDVIFEKFTQAENSTTRSFGGTGLGLTISRKLAQALGGEIRVISKPGRGTTFIIHLPLKATEKPEEDNLDKRLPPYDKDYAALKSKLASAKTDGPPKTLDAMISLLVVEDDRYNTEVIRSFLKHSKIQITVAENGLAINMQWDYLNLANGQIHLPDSKTVRKTLFLINKVK